MKDEVWFGYHLPPEGRDFEVMKSACITAEKAGLDLFTITDHLMNMGDPHGEGGHPLECWTLLGALSAVTNKIRLGPLVGCYGYRHPTLLAKIATTVDIISNGRLVMGIGAGWHEAEFKGFFGGFPSIAERVQGYSETLAILDSMFKNKFTTYNGQQFSANNTLNNPGPIQEHVPLMVGAFGPRTIRIATEYADIIHCLFEPTLEKVASQKQKIIDGAKKTGRDPDQIRMAAGYQIWLDPTPEQHESRVMNLVRRNNISRDQAEDMLKAMPSTPEQHIDELNSLIANGVKVFTFVGETDKLPNFAEKVLKKVR